MLWAPAFPGGPLLAFIDGIVQIRLDAQMLCRLHRRPVWKDPEGATTWTAVLNVLGFAAILTNTLSINFVGGQNAHRYAVPDEEGYWEDVVPGGASTQLQWQGGHGLRLEHNSYIGRWSVAALWLRALGVEHFSLAVQLLVVALAPRNPSWINMAQHILEFRSRTIFLTKAQRELQLATQRQYEAKLVESRAAMAETLAGFLSRSDEMRSLFDALDVVGTQCLSQHQVGEFFERMGVRLSEEELRIAMGAMDADGSGEVQFEELHAWIGHQVNGVSDGDDALVVEL